MPERSPSRSATSITDRARVDDLCEFLRAATSPFHAVAEAARRLDAAGFTRCAPDGRWAASDRRGYVARGGNLTAWSAHPDTGPDAPLRLVGAHTDSPNLRLLPRPEGHAAGLSQLGVEVYGGALLNSWLNRDLGLSGRLTVRGDSGPEHRLFCIDRPLLTVPQLAIHLDRSVNKRGLVLNPQTQLRPVWAVEADDVGALLAAAAGVEPGDVLGCQAMAHDLCAPARLGAHGELLASARLDNLVSCWAAVEALVAVEPAPSASAVITLFDHEEVGSVSATGAAGAWLGQVLERLVRARGGDRDDLLRALPGSICASADGAHATHPNYPERHEPHHPVVLNGGPAVKFNANQRYATDDATAAVLLDACDRAGVPVQRFVNRVDLPCGSTIGPATAAHLAIPTADIGVPQLSMHAARELCGVEDPDRLGRALTAFLRPDPRR